MVKVIKLTALLKHDKKNLATNWFKYIIFFGLDSVVQQNQ